MTIPTEEGRGGSAGDGQKERGSPWVVFLVLPCLVPVS